MASSKSLFRRRWWIILPVILIVVVASVFLITRKDASAGGLTVGQDTVVVRYRFGGEVITQYVNGVATITEYRRPDVLFGVVFNLKNGKDYVLNADKLVDYRIAPDSTIEKRPPVGKVYYRYDPYLQGEKQGWHKEWVDQEYLKWVGRLPTDAEWLEILNELTRGVEHPQMELWIQYSPPAIRHFIEAEYQTASGRKPTETEMQPLYKRLLNGESYDKISADIHAQSGR